MDHNSEYKKQLQYYEYFENQRKNYIDLSTGQADINNSVVELAKILFDKSSQSLCEDLTGIFIDNTMETADIFCMLVELVLYGLNILTLGDSTVFELCETTDDIVFNIKSYLKSMGFDMKVEQDYADDDVLSL